MSPSICDHRSARPVRRAEQRCDLCWSVGEDSRVVGPGWACGCGWSAVTQDAGLAHERLSSHHHAVEVRHHVASLRSEVSTARAELERIRASLPVARAEVEAELAAETREARKNATVAIREARAKTTAARADLASVRKALTVERGAIRSARVELEENRTESGKTRADLEAGISALASERDRLTQTNEQARAAQAELDRLTCSECGAVLSRPDALDRHVRSAHGRSAHGRSAHGPVRPGDPSGPGDPAGPAPPPNTAPSPDNVTERPVSPPTPPPPGRPGARLGEGAVADPPFPGEFNSSVRGGDHSSTTTVRPAGWGAERVPCPECGKAVRRDALNRHRARCAARRPAP